MKEEDAATVAVAMMNDGDKLLLDSTPSEMVTFANSSEPNVSHNNSSALSLEDPPTPSTMMPPRNRKGSSIFRKIITIGLTFAISIGMNLYNTYIFNKQRFNLGLPIFVAALYDVVQFSLTVLIVMIRSKTSSGPSLITIYNGLSMKQFLRFILPCSIAAALSIALSNSSLQHVSLSFYTMVKSCGPLFVFIFALAFGLEKPTRSLFGIMALIGVGIVLTVWDAVSFNMLGFVLLLGATIVSGLRWTLTQLIIESSSLEDFDEDSLVVGSGPLNTMLFLSPTITLSLLTLSMIFEGPTTILNSAFFRSLPSASVSIGVCLLGGMQTFILVLLEYQVVHEISLLTSSIVGVVKEIILIGVSVLVFGDEIKLINLLGAAISIVGICLYNAYKIRRKASGVDKHERRIRRTAGVAMQNMFMAVPTSEPVWMLDPLNDSTDSIDSTLFFWSRAPNPSPTTTTQKLLTPTAADDVERKSSLREPRKIAKRLFDVLGGSLRSSRTASPARRGHEGQISGIEMNKL